MPQIILPHADYEQSYCDYIEELGNEERYPFVMDFPHLPFANLIQRLDDLSKGLNVPDGAVANITYWLVERGEIIGVANLRPRLTPAIAAIGGHIGLGVRPSWRGKGMSKTLLEATLEKAVEHGLKTVSIHTHTENTSASAMIIACGGKLDSTIMDDSGKPVLRYVWTSK